MLSTLALTGNLQMHFRDLPWGNILAGSEHLFKVLAIIGAGFWTYYHFFKARTFRPRLVPTLSCSMVLLGKLHHIEVVATLKNVGLSDVFIDTKVSALRVLEYKPAKTVPFVDSVPWETVATLEAFKEHEWIEPGETIENQWLIAVPASDHCAFRTELRIAGRKTSWYASALAMKPS